eukprot:1203985-Lingulodinium_polyedra.AAC.1
MKSVRVNICADVEFRVISGDMHLPRRMRLDLRGGVSVDLLTGCVVHDLTPTAVPGLANHLIQRRMRNTPN